MAGGSCSTRRSSERRRSGHPLAGGNGPGGSPRNENVSFSPLGEDRREGAVQRTFLGRIGLEDTSTVFEAVAVDGLAPGAA